MKPMPHIVSLMTPFPNSIEASQTLHDAKLLMAAQAIRNLPVTSEGRLVGLLSDRDLSLALAVAGAQDPSGRVTTDVEESLHVGDVCNLEAYIVEFDTPIDVVVRRMKDDRLGSTLVTRNGRLVGIFTTTDVCRHYEELLRTAYPDA